jgi:enamine deaminase RidA (YjgF/YER057c/UK114 family)
LTEDPVVSRLARAGTTLPSPVNPVANYISGVIAGESLVFLSGQGTRKDGIFQYVGKVGHTISLEEGYNAARICAVNMLAQLHLLCGLSSVLRVVKLTGFVNAAPEFTDLPKVLNGASDLMAEAFGEAGRHARSAVGVATLPFGMAVEVEGIFEISRTTDDCMRQSLQNLAKNQQ